MRSFANCLFKDTPYNCPDEIDKIWGALRIGSFLPGRGQNIKKIE